MMMIKWGRVFLVVLPNKVNACEDWRTHKWPAAKTNGYNFMCERCVWLVRLTRT